MYIIGVDVGGTAVKCGLISSGEIIDKISVPTNTFDIVRQIENIIVQIIEKNSISIEDVSGIGVGIPGIVIDGSVKESVNLGLNDCSLQDILKEKFGVDVRVLNDGNMATLAEYKYGNGKGSLNMVMLTIGTGIGGGIIVNGDLYVGNGGSELGHITFVRNGNKCNCGRSGCIEQYVSYRALSNRAKSLMESMPNRIPYTEPFIDATNLVKAMKEGDECATIILQEYIEDLADGVLDYCNIFRPDKIIVGGGISYATEIIEAVATKCKEKNYGYINSPSVDILPAKFKNDAGIMGAGALF